MTLDTVKDFEELKKQGKIRVLYYHMGNSAKISAIKLFREITGMDLKDSKDWVESEMEELKNYNSSMRQ